MAYKFKVRDESPEDMDTKDILHYLDRMRNNFKDNTDKDELRSSLEFLKNMLGEDDKWQ